MLSTLNQRQKEAVLATEGPMLIIAGAGSGKTMVLTHKIAHLVLENGVSLDKILAVTFTNKAALEMKERVFALLQKRENDFFIGTFHSICLKIIREHALLCDRDPNFVVADAKAQESAIKSIMEEHKIDEKQYAPELFMYHISKLKNKLIGADEYAGEAAGMFPGLAARVYLSYERMLKQQNAVDFDDIIMFCVKLLKTHADVLARYQERFRYLFVDEYQDTNHAQYQFTRLLAKKHGNICVVGDSDQAIYGWRQADMSNILNFEKDYPQATVFVLEENYRSTKTILAAANMVIRKNKVRKEKNLFTQNELGAKIAVVATRNETDEAQFVAEKIRQLMRSEGYSFSDFAVLYRTNAQSRVIEETFMKHGITYRITGGFKFYDRKEIRDMLAYLRLVHNDRDTASLKRAINTPPRGIGKASLEKFLRDGTRTKHIDAFFDLMRRLRIEQQTMNLARFIKLVAKESGMERELRDGTGEEVSRWENILELASAASSYGDVPAASTMGAFLDNVALVSQEEKTLQHSVNLMTMHAAKGLEFPAVFIVGAEDNIFPHQRSKRTPLELEEERRLCYVAITRAQKYVYFLYAKMRRLYGQTQANPPSRFLFDIPEHLVSFEEYRGATMPRDLDVEDGIIDIEA
ncbi:hypothetical protein A3C91_03770 [Candidatus Azambacteria bacterium RIFCSPHIGHO2_02_FULL_52_12]|uniref:DNA 3'-5' helicase n=1 Tax=Candidatus Azambacteria bacterium RIFCSPLOWO2_01_FULL_46_25 TaxID=1797298 RepID=A0A1F5BUT4_9BACT|nr:MAG: hypothetical protein A3C91_03770 [Candidatus Azambacteria bacterium RIFCSPHIGHO2_02_FULL_52_12]OGD34352.1 MAG: hypothetical protein A2988_02380 [Candidatus Azambacteria bacterium RIFCSPLOWO2_01_FULL_46_25]OGD37370.1 MAG: hypothetical protein A2850_01505 [Candidatus Azambacteria bacterium RIFCSPHIGHO2_01_FULL_51_74]